MDCAQIRFVGGSLHNKIEFVELRERIECPVYEKVPVTQYTPQVIHKPKVHIDTYRLFQFVSDRGTRYWQYIHTSLIVANEPLPCTYMERLLPPLALASFDMFVTSQLINLERLR